MSFAAAIVVGVVLALPVLALAYFLPRSRALDLMAVQLAAIAAVYAGSSLAGGSFSVISVEVAAITAFFAASLFGRWGSPAILVVGYLAHGAWDIAHHLGSIPTFLPDWYGPFCLAYDLVVAAFVGAFLLGSSTDG